MMKYSVRYNEEENIVEFSFQGNLDLQAAKIILQEIISLLVEKHCFLLLTDLREAVMSLSIMDIYDLPQIMDDMSFKNGLNLHTVRRAVLTKEKDYLTSFYETVFYNRGYRTMMFEDNEKAIQWLQAQR